MQLHMNDMMTKIEKCQYSSRPIIRW